MQILFIYNRWLNCIIHYVSKTELPLLKKVDLIFPLLVRDNYQIKYLKMLIFKLSIFLYFIVWICLTGINFFHHCIGQKWNAVDDIPQPFFGCQQVMKSAMARF